MLLIVLPNNSIGSKSLIQHPASTFWMLCRLWYRLFWNQCFSFYDLHFWLLRLSIFQLWAEISAQWLDYPIYKTKHCSPSVDADFQDGATKIWCTIMAEKAASTLYMNYCHKASLGLPKMHDQKSLRLNWLSFSGWGRVRATVVFATKGGRCVNNGCLQPIAT